MGKIKLLLYCTRQMPRLVFTDGKWWLDNSKENTYWEKEQPAPIGYNGKIIAECDYDVEEIECRTSVGTNGIHDEYTTKSLGENELLFASKIDEITFINYLKGKNGYAIHIKNLNIFDRPRKLSCYSTYTKEIINTWWFYLNHKKAKQLEKAPQNMMYCYGNNTGEKYILISIHPEWLCKILNGEKTIEVRKKVLKEMIMNGK